MGQLRTQFEQLQHEAFRRWLESSLALLTVMVLQGYLCLIILVILVPFYLVYYIPPTLTRLLYQMIFRERFALFRAGPCWRP